MRVKTWFLCGLLVACTSEPGDTGPDAGPDPDADPGPDPSAQELTLHAKGTALVAVRDASGAWRSVQSDAAGDAKVATTGAFTVASVCDQPDLFNYWTNYGGPGLTELNVSCPEPSSAPAPASTLVTIPDLPAPVSVRIGGLLFTKSTPQRAVPSGIYDVVALDRSAVPNRFEIRRDVEITGSAMELQFDLASTGTDLQLVPVAVTADPADQPRVIGSLRTVRRTTIQTVADGELLQLFPASALAVGDRARIDIAADREGGITHWVQRVISGAEPSHSFEVFSDGIASATATWDRSPRVRWEGGNGDWPTRYFSMGNQDNSMFWDATLYPEWVAAGGSANEIAIPNPAEIPGWQPRWNLAYPTGLSWYLHLSRRVSSTETHISELSSASFDGAPAVQLAGSASSKRPPSQRLPARVLEKLER